MNATPTGRPLQRMPRRRPNRARPIRSAAGRRHRRLPLPAATPRRRRPLHAERAPRRPMPRRLARTDAWWKESAAEKLSLRRPHRKAGRASRPRNRRTPAPAAKIRRTPRRKPRRSKTTPRLAPKRNLPRPLNPPRSRAAGTNPQQRRSRRVDQTPRPSIRSPRSSLLAPSGLKPRRVSAETHVLNRRPAMSRRASRRLKRSSRPRSGNPQRTSTRRLKRTRKLPANAPRKVRKRPLLLAALLLPSTTVPLLPRRLPRRHTVRRRRAKREKKLRAKRNNTSRALAQPTGCKRGARSVEGAGCALPLASSLRAFYFRSCPIRPRSNSRSVMKNW